MYDEEGHPRIHTMLDWVPGAPVDCRLKLVGITGGVWSTLQGTAC